MPSKTISLNQEFKRMIHRPVTKDGFVLYVKANQDENANKSELYKKQSLKNYNSPSNIRRLFFLGDCVYIHYYVGPIIGGNAGKTVLKKSYKENLYDVAKKMLTYPQEMSNYNMEKAINKKAVEPTKYNVEGSFKSVLNNILRGDYVLPNLEEIYFDWTVLLGSGNGMFGEFISENYMAEYINGNFPNTYVATDKMQLQSEKMGNRYKNPIDFAVSNLNLAKGSSRLKHVAIIGNLKAFENIIQGPTLNNGNNLLDKPYFFDIYEKEIKEVGKLVINSTLAAENDVDKYNFKVQTGMYKFDAEVLNARIESCINNFKNKSLVDKYAENSENNTNTEVNLSKIEKRIEEIKANTTEQEFNSIILCTVGGAMLGTKELTTIIKNFTKPNRRLISNILGLKLK